MLQLRPSCEHCDRDLPPSSTHAMICSFECTFCEDCVHNVLDNVCPNCGGGFVPRPIRPVENWRPGTSVANHPPVAERRFRPVDLTAHAALVAKVAGTPPAQR
ncbi:MAG: DUF1272 domain-containing protein [Pseudomonadota bacterium]